MQHFSKKLDWSSLFDLAYTYQCKLNHFCIKVLRYVGVVDVVNKKGQVELRRYKRDHPFAQLSGSDNIIAFTTSRYKEQPLIVRGPGAGAEVTAGGVFSDILRLASYLGAPS
jgi:aspartokinase/homoserine dehydrogenase 1